MQVEANTLLEYLCFGYIF